MDARQFVDDVEYWHYLDFKHIFGEEYFNIKPNLFSAKPNQKGAKKREHGLWAALSFPKIKKKKKKNKSEADISNDVIINKHKFYNGHIKHLLNSGIEFETTNDAQHENPDDALLSRYAVFCLFKNGYDFSTQNSKLIFAKCYFIFPECDIEKLLEYTDHYVRKGLRDELKRKEYRLSGILKSAGFATGSDYSDFRNWAHDILFDGMSDYQIKKRIIGIKHKDDDPIANYFNTEMLMHKNNALGNVIKQFTGHTKATPYFDNFGKNIGTYEIQDYDLSQVKKAIESEYKIAHDKIIANLERPEEKMTPISTEGLKTILTVTENNFIKQFSKQTLTGKTDRI